MSLVTHLLSVSIDFTYVTLVSDDTYGDYEEGKEYVEDKIWNVKI